jgi:DNA-binding response OmpR family regulator
MPRVILVEDEPLVAMMMEDLLADLGCEVAGSFGSLGTAMAWLGDFKGVLDGALLDVNLGGGGNGLPVGRGLARPRRAVRLRDRLQRVAERRLS